MTFLPQNTSLHLTFGRIAIFAENSRVIFANCVFSAEHYFFRSAASACNTYTYYNNNIIITRTYWRVPAGTARVSAAACVASESNLRARVLCTPGPGGVILLRVIIIRKHNGVSRGGWGGWKKEEEWNEKKDDNNKQRQRRFRRAAARGRNIRRKE